jgi:hypothetical protein
MVGVIGTTKMIPSFDFNKHWGIFKQRLTAIHPLETGKGMIFFASRSIYNQ